MGAVTPGAAADSTAGSRLADTQPAAGSRLPLVPPAAERLPAAPDRHTALIHRYAPLESHFFAFDPGPLRRLAISADGNTLCAAARDELIAWDTRTGIRTARLRLEQTIAQIALNGDGTRAVVADCDAVLHFVDLASGAIERQETAAGAITALAASADSALLVLGAADGRVRLLRTQTGAMGALETSVPVLETPGPVLGLRLDTGRDLLLVNGVDTIRVYRISSGELVMSCHGDDQTVPELESDWQSLVVTGNGRIVVFDSASGSKSGVPITAWASIDSTPGGTLIVAAAANRLKVWEGHDCTQRLSIETYIHVVQDVKVSPRGDRIFTCGENSSVDVHTPSGRWLSALASEYALIVGATTLIDDTRLVVADEMGFVSVYDTSSGRVRRYKQHDSCIAKLRANGVWIATSGYDGSAAVLDARTGETVRRVATDRAPMQAVAIDGADYLITGNALGAVERHAIGSGRVDRCFSGNRSAVRSICVSACRRLLATTSDDGEVLIFDYATGTLRHRISVFGIVYDACFDSSGEFCFFGDALGGIRQVCAATGEILGRWRLLESPVRSINVRGDRLCAVGLKDDAILFDWTTGSLVLRVPIDTSLRRRIAFLSAAGTRFIAGSQDGRLWFHDAESGARLAALHHLSEGFLWSTETGAGDEAGGAWFWTDRPELVSVQSGPGGARRLLERGDPARDEYIRSRNSRSATMSRAGLSAGDATASMEACLSAHRAALVASRAAALLEHHRHD